MPLTALRRRTYEVLNGAVPGDRVGRVFGVGIVALINLNLAAMIVETVEWIGRPHRAAFWTFEVVSVGLFTVEYLARLWSCVEDRRYRRPVLGRLRMAVSPLMLVDLLAILPFYAQLVQLGNLDLRFLRSLRLARLMRIVKLGRYSTAMQTLGRVAMAKRAELTAVASVIAVLLVLTASVLYYAEHAAQPDKFPHIPGAMWWAIVTLTTVGYGDVYPVTAWGQLAAGLSAVLGLGMVALPAGILSAGFMEEIGRARQPKTCPHCGKDLEAPGG